MTDKKKKQETLYALCRTDFMAFARKGFEILHPGKQFLLNWHHEAIAHELMYCSKSEAGMRLLVNMPPQHMKSELISVLFTAWMLGTYPGLSIINISYSDDLVRKFTRATLKIMESDFYKKTFPKTKVSSKKKSETEIETTAGGRRYATTTGGQLTGHGADIIVIDDPHKIGPSLTEEELKKNHQWYDEGLCSRLTSPDTGTIIVVMQRSRPNDLSGHLLLNDSFRHLCLPLVATEDERIPLGAGKMHFRKKGEILHPEWRGEDAIKLAKKTPYVFEAQYQQNPTPGGGFIIKPDYVQRYEQPISRNACEYVLLAIDGASSLDEDSSYSAAVVVGVRNNCLAVMHVWRDHVEFPDLLEVTEELMNEFRPTHVIPEKAASGIQLAQILYKKHDGRGIYPTIPRGSKEDRLYETLRFFTEERVYLPGDKSQFPWLPPFEQELFTFPSCNTSDQVDALVHILRGIDLGVFHRAQVQYS